ncbi:MAG: nickel pincer cofactor biosynthesis protein LarC [Acidobacteria bacterium]|nr:nickel pincer cofactor biosynthesis protein LarC [Acidobacteriota bacterium]
MNVAWFNCSAGVAGDMLLGSLVDAGADPAAIADIVSGLNVDGWALTTDRVDRCGIAATHAVVVEHHHHDDDHHDHVPHRPYRDIVALINAADIPDGVRSRSLAVFRTLGEAEAKVHGVAVNNVEFHEVGSLDAIVDVVGTCAALHVLGIDTVVSSPLATSHGTVRSAHGKIPSPGPAVAMMLATRNAPVRGIDVDYEVSTPTGVAIITSLAASFGPSPTMTVTAVGHGAGTKNPPDRANVVQVVIGDSDDTTDDVESLIVLETNTDDVTPEVLAYTVGALMAAGANDAWVTPILMKKERHGHCLQVLCRPEMAHALRTIISRETGSLGVRSTTLQRFASARRIIMVDVLGHSIDVKCNDHRVKAEFDHSAQAARATGLPLREVMRLAEDTARRLLGDNDEN